MVSQVQPWDRVTLHGGWLLTNLLSPTVINDRERRDAEHPGVESNHNMLAILREGRSGWIT
jgi:hypothetical protein